MLLGTYNLAGAVTFTGLWLSVGAWYWALRGRIDLASVMLIWSGVCDLLDGPLARRRRSSAAEKIFGTQIDSLVDLVSFGVTPAVCCFQLGLDSGWDYPLLAIYVSAAAMRLATFNTLKHYGKLRSGTYRGLPVTYAALVFPLAFLLDRLVGGAYLRAGLRLVMAGMSVAFVLDVPMSKPSRKGYFFLILVALGLSLLWLGLGK